MTGISAISSSTPNTNTNPKHSSTYQKDKSEQVAAGVGGAAGITTSASKFASKQGLKAQAAEKVLQQGMETVTNANKTIQKNKKVVTGLWGTFKKNIGKYSNDISKRIGKFKDSKIIGPIIRSNVTKSLSKALGGILAFFVFTTGIVKAFRTGAIALDDMKKQFQEIYG